MGNFLSYVHKQFYGDIKASDEPFKYAIYDPLQTAKPEGKTKDIISYKNRSNPARLDSVVQKGCDTVWKCFKRAVWLWPDNPFLGERGHNKASPYLKYNLP